MGPNDTRSSPRNSAKSDRRPGPRRLQAFLGRSRSVFKAWLIFLAIIALLVAVDEWASYWVNVRFAELTAQATAWAMWLLGAQGRAEGALLVTSVCTFEIIGECTAYYPCALFIAAVFAYPCRWTRKLLGIGLGIPMLLLGNVVRLVSLCYLYRWFPLDFEMLHVLVWQSLILVFTIFLWNVWVYTLARV